MYCHAFDIGSRWRSGCLSHLQIFMRQRMIHASSLNHPDNPSLAQAARQPWDILILAYGVNLRIVL